MAFTKKLLMEKVVDTLRKSDLEVYGYNFDDNKWYVTADSTIITIPSKDEIFVSFHVNTRPDTSAVIILLLNQIENIKVCVNDIFIYDKDGKIFYGKEAEVMTEEQNKKQIIDNFIQDQYQIQFLLTNQVGGKCWKEIGKQWKSWIAYGLKSLDQKNYQN